MDRMRSLYSGHKGRSKLLSVLKKSPCMTSLISLSEINCVTVDGFSMLNLLQKTEHIKTDADLVNAVCLWVDNKKKLCSTVIIAFDTYQKVSLKSATRNEVTQNQTHNITTFHRQRILLAHKKKPNLIELLMGPLRDHLSSRGLQLVVAGNFITYHSTYGEATNNHEEADTLLIHCITSSKLNDKRVWVYASDVDVAVLLIAHRNL